ncbi:MAG TPA: hypothetical protein VIL95_03340 [Bacillota bacterium]
MQHALHALQDGDFEWAAFAAHQALQRRTPRVHPRITPGRRPKRRLL